MITPKKIFFHVFFAVFVFGMTCLLALSAGVEFISPFHFLEPSFAPIGKLRLSRILLGVISGGSLALSGCVFQVLLKNPLADPFILGISASAALGATIAFALHLPYNAIILFSLLSALIALGIIIFVAQKKGPTASNFILLTGVLLGFLFSAIVTLFLTFATPYESASLIFWLMGSLSHPVPLSISWISLGIVFGISLFLFLKSYELNLLNLGLDEAHALGADLLKTQRRFYLLASFLTALSVALTGMIGFIGLILPHVIRKFWGTDHRLTLPLHLFWGATFLIFTDACMRTLSPYEMPLGVITALVGAPIFLWILWKGHPYQ